MGPLDDPMADDFFIPNPPLDRARTHDHRIDSQRLNYMK